MANFKENKHNILLGGGCFQNRLLLEMLVDFLEAHDLTVYTGEQIPVNDGGIALGQIYVASMQQNQL